MGIFGGRDAQCEKCRTIYRLGEKCPNCAQAQAEGTEEEAKAQTALEASEAGEGSAGRGTEEVEEEKPKRRAKRDY